MESSRKSQVQDQPFLLKFDMTTRHTMELVQVNAANLAAIAVSLSEAEQWIRIVSCIAAAVYTILKIVQTIRELKK